MNSVTSSPVRVLVAGGGVAGLEALLALRDLAGERVALTLLSSEPEFVYRPMAVAEPFARGHAQRHGLSDIAASVGAEFVRGALAEVDDAQHTAITTDGHTLSYDAVVVAVGAAGEPALRRVLTWTPESDAEVFGGLLRDLEEGYATRVAFVVPPGAAWPLPAYELALMTAWDARDMNRDDVEITVYTTEEAPLGVFGSEATTALRTDLADAGIRVEVSAYVTEDDRGRLVVQPGDRGIDAERVVALPRAAARPVGGLPVDSLGFILTDPYGKVVGTQAVWAAGDAISFPVKQGGLAAQQADAAAESIAALAGVAVDPRPFRPVLRGVLLTGRGRQWIRRELDDPNDPGRAERHALWWPPTKVAGRYLAPFLASLEDAERVDENYRPEGRLVQLDLERELPAVADALTLARLRVRATHADHELRRAELGAAEELRDLQSGLDRLRVHEQETEAQLRQAGYLKRGRRPMKPAETVTGADGDSAVN
jgi:sulfide:quinone oxidoreductase